MTQWTSEDGMGSLENWLCMKCIIWVVMIKRLQVIYTSSCKWQWRSARQPALANFKTKNIGFLPLSYPFQDFDQGKPSSLWRLWYLVAVQQTSLTIFTVRNTRNHKRMGWVTHLAEMPAGLYSVYYPLCWDPVHPPHPHQPPHTHHPPPTLSDPSHISLSTQYIIWMLNRGYTKQQY